MNAIMKFLEAMASKVATWTHYDSEEARLMGEMNAMVADLEWPIW